MKPSAEDKGNDFEQLVMTPGRTLQCARIAQGIPSTDIQRQLGLSANTLSALEEDDYRRLPAPVYVKGYIKNYAEIVQVRSAPLLKNYQAILERQGLSVSEVVKATGDGRPTFAMLGSALALLLATSLVFGAILSEGLIPSDHSVVDELQPKATSSPSEQAEIEASDSPENQLSLVFSSESWVEVVDARDHILTVSLQRAGTQLILEGTPPFRVKVDNGPAVTMSYLGQPVTFDYDSETFSAEITLGR